MTKPLPRTIQLFLPTGQPRGIRIAHITSRIPLAVCVPREDLAQALSRAELSRSGVYFLFGDIDDSRIPVYVGESENCLERLKQWHNSEREWNTAVIVVSKTDDLTRCHIRFLEWYCCSQIKILGRAHLLNKSFAQKEPFLSESAKADAMEMYETMTLLLSTLDYPIFQRLHTDLAKNHVFCKSGKAFAKGEKIPDGFLVFKGSLGPAEIVDSAGPTLKRRREELVEAGVVQRQGDQLVFLSDFLFPSPSQAAGVVLGRQANGWMEWRDAGGQTLDEMLR